VGTLLSSNALLSVTCVVAWNYGDPVPVPSDLTNVIGISSGNAYYVALKSNGGVDAWGDDTYGQTNVPPEATNVIAIGAGYNHTIALKNDGSILSWGDFTLVPPGLSNIVAVSAGQYHNMALASNGTVFAWGSTNAGTETNVPAGLSNVVAIAAGNGFSVALQANGTVVAWGSAPSTSGMTNIVAIAANASLLALTSEGTVIAPGVPWVDMASFTNIVGVGAGYQWAITLASDGTVGGSFWLWVPPIPAILNVLTIASGENQCMAILNDGQPLPQASLANASWATNGFSLSLPTQISQVYSLEYKNAVLDTNWNFLSVAAGNGGTITLMDNTATNAQRFYRVRKW